MEFEFLTEQIQQEERLKNNYKQENIWLMEIKKSIQNDIDKLERVSDTLKDKCRAKEPIISKLLKKMAKQQRK